MPQEKPVAIAPIQPQKPIRADIPRISVPRFKMGQAGGTPLPPLPEPTPFTPTPVDKPWTLAGWAKQQYDDISGPIRNAVPMVNTIIQGMKEVPESIATILKELNENPKALWDATSETLGEAWTALTEHYREKDGTVSISSFAKAFRDRPFLVALDALTLASLGAGGAAKAGKLASVVPGLGKFAEITKGVYAGTGVAGRLAKAANAFRKVERLPYVGLTKAWERLEKTRPVRFVERALQATPLIRHYAGVKGKINTEVSAALDRIHGDAITNLSRKGLTPEQMRHVTHVAASADTLDPAILGDKYDVSVKALKAHREVVDVRQRYQEEGLKFDTGEAGPEAHRKRTLKGIALSDRVRGIEAKLGRTIDTLPPEEQLRLKAVLEADPTADELTLASVKLENQKLKMAELAQKMGDPELANLHSEGLYFPWGEPLPDNLEEMLAHAMDPAAGFARQNDPTFRRLTGKHKLSYDPADWMTRTRVHTQILMTEASYIRKVAAEQGRHMKMAELLKNGGPPEGMAVLPPVYSKILDHQQIVSEMVLKKFVAEHIPEKFAAGVLNKDDLAKAVAEIGDEYLEKHFDDVLKSIRESADEVVLIPEDLASAIKTDIAMPSGLGRIYDKAMGWWRELVLLFNPRFHTGNLIGNSVLQLLYGVNPFKYSARGFERLPGEISQALAATSELSQAGGAVSRYANRAKAALSKLARMTDEVGRGNIMIAEMDELLKMRSTADKVAGALDLPKLDKIDNALKQLLIDARSELTLMEGRGLRTAPGALRPATDERVSAVRTQIERELRSRRLKVLAEPVNEAVAMTESFLGDYGKQIPMVRKYLRRVIPFWTFAKTMHQLYFRLALLQPTKALLWNRLAEMGADAMNDERVPYWMRNSVWIGTTADGKMLFARLGSLNPFEAVTMRKLGEHPFPSLFYPDQAPLFKVIHNMVGGSDAFAHDGALRSGERVHDLMGRTYEWDAERGQGMLVKPQGEMLSSLLETIPQVSILNDIMASSGFPVSKALGAEMGHEPKIYMGPDGKPINPRHWAMGLSRLLGSPQMDTADMGKAKLQERLVKQRLLKMYASRARLLQDPQQRAQVLRIIYDMARHPDVALVRE